MRLLRVALCRPSAMTVSNFPRISDYFTAIRELFCCRIAFSLPDAAET